MKLDFRTKFFMTVCVSTLLIAGNYNRDTMLFHILLGLVPLALFLTDGMFKVALRYGVIYGALSVANELLIEHSDNELYFGLFIISGIFCKLYPGLMMGYYTLKTTKMVDLVKSLKAIKMPDYLIIPISVMFRFFFSISHDYREIRKAMKLQNLGLASLFKQPVRTLEYAVVPLAMCSLRAADDVSISAMSRGLVPGAQRSSISDAKLKYYDYLLMLVMLGCIAFHIWSHYVRS